MTRMIDADALKENIRKNYVICTVGHYFDDLFQDFFNAIDDAPTIDAEPVRHGKWRFVNCATGLRCQCSECLHWIDAGDDKNYCPNCGARMDAK